MSRFIPFPRKAAVWLSLALGTAALSGCVVAPLDDGYYSSTPYYGTTTDGYYNGTYYPAIPTEVVPVAPYAGAIWVQGYWDIDNGRRYWRPGRYERPGWDSRGHSHPNVHRPNAPRPNWNGHDPRRPIVGRPDDRRPDRARNDPPRNNNADRNRPPSHQFQRPGQAAPNKPGADQGRTLRPSNQAYPGAAPSLNRGGNRPQGHKDPNWGG